MNKSLLLLIVLGFTLCGCASNVSKVKIADIDFENAVTPEGEKLYCRKEAITGTHRKTMTCLTRAEMDAGRKNSDLYMTRMKASPEVGKGGR